MENEYKLIKDYKEITKYRESLNELTQLTFGFDFKDYYDKGYWGATYIPYSLVHGNQVVANVSANVMTLQMNGRVLKAVQIGTVMTHPDHRKKGLAKQLMEEVEHDFSDYDFIYLFGNDYAKAFYLKCGYEPINEIGQYFTAKYTDVIDVKTTLRKLDVSLSEDEAIIERIIKTKQFQSQSIGTNKDEHLLNFHRMVGHNDHLYYSEKKDVILVITSKDDVVKVHDVWMTKVESFDVYMDCLYSYIRDCINPCDLIKVEFGFQPIIKGHICLDEYLLQVEDSTTMVKGINKEMLCNIMFPVLSHA